MFVKECLDSWEQLRRAGFEVLTFHDDSAAAYIDTNFGLQQTEAFGRCRHPAMRSDYFRMCYLLSSGGFYVDADDVLTEGRWSVLYSDNRLKLQPLCYDIPSASMVPTPELWRADLPSVDRIFYVNNNPLVAPSRHPVLRRALERATSGLLNAENRRDIQSTTGPGNLTAALAAHARELALAGRPRDFRLLRDWDHVAETRWELSYRADERNWRNVDRW
jgi:mannosyltransferase OCH1-like enzyme